MCDIDYIVCHYGEIALKGKNRKFFEERLVENIKLALGKGSFEYVKRISGRILVKIPNHKLEIANKFQITNSRLQTEYSEKMKKVFGIVNFAFAVSRKQNIEEIKKTALELLRRKRFKTFKVTASRSAKNFPYTSKQINEVVGEYILKKIQNPKSKIQNHKSKFKIKVDLENPDVTLYIEIVEKYTFLYTEKFPGPGGLPVGVSGKAVALLSGGIDSPVAAWYAMKRGLKVVFAHFHAYPYTNKASIEKARKLVNILDAHQYGSKLYLVPFGEIQKEILLKTPTALRVILYRRFMARIAEKIAEKENAQALVTGENLGQVASQTVQNMAAVEDAAELPILRPLLGFDKEEIIRKAREIGTFDISILPDQDCCSRFLPKHPATKAELGEVKKAEKKLNIDKLILSALTNSELVHLNR